MNQYQFEKIIRSSEREYGKIKKGEENDYAEMLMIMEMNLLKAHRNHPEAVSRRMSDAVCLALYDVDNRITGKEDDLSAFESEGSLALKHAMLMVFDPFTNSELAEALKNENLSFPDIETRKHYFGIYAMCMLRIRESAEFWIKEYGSDGYFTFCENTFGAEVEDDENYNFASLINDRMPIVSDDLSS